MPCVILIRVLRFLLLEAVDGLYLCYYTLTTFTQTTDYQYLVMNFHCKQGMDYQYSDNEPIASTGWIINIQTTNLLQARDGLSIFRQRTYCKQGMDYQYSDNARQL